MRAFHPPTRSFVHLVVCLRLLSIGHAIIAVASFSSPFPTHHRNRRRVGRRDRADVVTVVASRRHGAGRCPSLLRSMTNGDGDSDDDDSRRRYRSSKSTSSRRTFVASCIASAALCVSSNASPSNSIESTTTPFSSRDGNDDVNDVSDENDAMIETTSAVVVDVPIAAGDSNVDKTRTMTAFQESLSGFVSGSAVSIAKTLVKYPLDTVTVRLQMPNSRYGWHDVPTLFGGCLDGVLAPLLSNVPSAGVFFAIKDATKSALYGSGQDLPKWAITMMAVGAAQPPYWLLRNPSEVVKTRLQVGSVGYGGDMSTIDAFRLALGFANDDERNDGDDDDDVDGNGNGKKCARKDDDDNDNNNNNAIMDGVSGLYVGYGENIMYAYPADIIKFGIYEYLTGGGTSGAVSPANGALCGALSTAISQFVTTPLDVLRNRIMAEVTTTTTTKSSPSYVADCDDDRENDARVAIRAGPSYVDRLTKIATEEGTGALFAGSWPRVAKAMLSGAIQFATYEETKQKMSEMFIGRR